ncbi:MAG TPA: hypothetical protein VNE39_21055 [Planctomycetota bacterium]|nr:hypothetical protein [Planctomycetota bacterium]
MSTPAAGQGSRRPSRGRAFALAVVALSALGVAWVVSARPPLGVPGQYVYPYRPAPPWGMLALLALLGLPLAGGWAYALVGGGPPSRRAEWAAVGALTLGSLVLHVGTACLPKLYTGAELMWPFVWQNTEGSYAHEAGDVASARRFVSNYAHWLEVSPVPNTPRWVHIHHPQVHPPGPILAFVGLESFFRARPGLAAGITDWAERDLPSSKVLDQGEDESRLHSHPAATALTLAFLAVAIASLAPLACYLAVRPLWPRVPSLVAAGLTALVPGTHLFSPSFDQAYPVLTLLLVACGVRAILRRSWAWGAAFGGVLYGLAFFHIGFGLVAASLALTTLLAWRAGQSPLGPREAVCGYWRPVAAAALAFLTLAALLQVSLGYPTFRVICMCLRNNALFNAAAGRTWWPWVAVVPFEFAVSLGFGLALVVLGGWLAEVVGAIRSRCVRGRSALLLAPVALLAALDILGMNRGETARLWLFLTPLLVLGAVDYVWRRAREPRHVFARLGAAQALQVLAFAIVLDLGWTTTFMVRLLGH